MFTLAERLPFINNLLSLSQGRETYLSLSEQNYLQNSKSKPFKYEGFESQDKDEREYFPIKGQQVELVADFWTGDKKIRYLLWNNTLYAEISDYAHNTVRIANVKKESAGKSIWIGGNTHNLPFGLSSIFNYLKGMESSFKTYFEKIQELNKEGKTENVVWEKLILHRLLFHLYGFGFQAGTLGDEVAKQKAFDLISQFTDIKDIKKTVEEKMDSDGKIKLTQEDLMI